MGWVLLEIKIEFRVPSGGTITLCMYYVYSTPGSFLSRLLVLGDQASMLPPPGSLPLPVQAGSCSALPPLSIFAFCGNLRASPVGTLGGGEPQPRMLCSCQGLHLGVG